MIAAREAAIEPALQHMIERRDFLGDAHRIVGGHGVSHDSRLHPLAVLPDKQAEHTGMIVRLEPLDLEMMFGLAVAVKAEFIGMLHITAHFLEEALVKFRSLAGHSLFDFVPPPDDAGLHQMEFHSPLLTQSFLSTHALIGRVVPRCQWTI